MQSRILLTGATGNLGGKLALRLAKPGAHLSLWGRNTIRLSAIADPCRARGALVDTRSIDLCDLDAALAALDADDDAGPFDLVLLVAGQGDSLAPGAVVEDAAQVARLGQANYVAPAAMAAAIAARMVCRGHGRIGLVGTAAASHSLPFAAAYAASKAGLARYADALRLAVKPHGVSVTLISPGFFAADDGIGSTRSRPGEVSADAVAERMIAAVMAGKAELVMPRRFLLLRWLDRFLPRPLRDRVLLSLRLP